MTDFPPPPDQPPTPPPSTPPTPPPQYTPPAPPTPAYPVAAPAAPVERIRDSWQRRSQTDYIFNFWTAFGWTLLTCGLYVIYVIYQLVRRSRDHNLRRIEMLDAATAFAWDQAQAKGLAEELRPSFERIAPHLAVLRQKTTEFRDPVLWMVIAIFASGIAQIIVFILLDGDLIAHDHAEGAIETELAAIYARLGAPVAAPNPARLKGPHNYVGRVIAALLTCGIYTLFWEYDVMTEGNRHFEENWRWEDDLAQSVQQLTAA